MSCQHLNLIERWKEEDWRVSKDGGRWAIGRSTRCTGGAGHALVLVEHKSGYVAIGKLARLRVAEINAATLLPDRRRVRTITADNGTRFHGYWESEKASGVKFYFATPHHAGEGTKGSSRNCVKQDAVGSEAER